MYKDVEIVTEEGFGNSYFPVLKSDGKTIPFSTVIGWQTKIEDDLGKTLINNEDLFLNINDEQEIFQTVVYTLQNSLKANPSFFNRAISFLTERGGLVSKVRLAFFQDDDPVGFKIKNMDKLTVIDSSILMEAILESLSGSITNCLILLVLFGEIPEEAIPKTDKFEEELLKYVNNNECWKNEDPSKLWFVEFWKTRALVPKATFKVNHRVVTIDSDSL